jgi:hypothetical protein
MHNADGLFNASRPFLLLGPRAKTRSEEGDISVHGQSLIFHHRLFGNSGSVSPQTVNPLPTLSDNSQPGKGY